MKAHRVKKYKCVTKDGWLYQSKNPFVRWYFYRRFDVAIRMSGISKEDVVLDVGIFEGFFVPSLALHAKQVYACDIDTGTVERRNDMCKWGWGKRWISLAKEMLVTELGERAIKKSLFLYANASHLPFRDESFDIVFLLDCLEHMSYHENKLAIPEIHRVLKEGGVFICSLPIEKGPILLLREIIRRIIFFEPRYSLRELIRAFVYNAAIGEWKGGHEGYDFTIDMRKIKEVFTQIYPTFRTY